METNKEEKVIVLDFLPNGYPFDQRPVHLKTSVAQVIGTNHFTLLEVTARKGIHLQPYEELYIGEGKRDKVERVQGKLSIKKLTSTARTEIPFAIDDIIAKDERRFVDFINNAQPLSVRTHQLELLPGLGKKHMWEILEARKDGPFTSFEDLRKRVHLMPDPKKIIAKRVLSELEGKEKHNLFVDK